MAVGGPVDIFLNSTTILVAVVVAVLTYWFLSYRRPKNAPPGPPAIPMFGSMLFMNTDKYYHLMFVEMARKYGDVFSFYHGNKFTVVLNDYDSIKEAFVSKGVDFAGRPNDDPRVELLHYNYPKMGIIDNDYSEEWKRQRNAALGVMRQLGWGKRSLEAKIQEEAALLIDHLVSKGLDQFDPAPVISVSVCNIICSLLFGTRYSHDDRDLLHLLSMVDLQIKGLSDDTDAIYVPVLRLRSSYRKTIAGFKRANKELRLFFLKQIEGARERIASGEEADDFLSLYLKELEGVEDHQDKSHITQDWLYNIVSDFFAAGAETTATTLKWALLYMANYPEIQEKVHDELDNVIGKEPYQFCLADRERLPYTDATIMEIQRLGSIAPVGLVHKTMKDVKLRNYIIPKGTEVWANIYNVLHDKTTWWDPDNFRPERFLGKDGKLNRNENWIPFSMGRRVCLGEQLARQELFIFFTHVMHSLKIRLPDGVQKLDEEGIWKVVLAPKPYTICAEPIF